MPGCGGGGVTTQKNGRYAWFITPNRRRAQHHRKCDDATAPRRGATKWNNAVSKTFILYILYPFIFPTLHIKCIRIITFVSEHSTFFFSCLFRLFLTPIRGLKHLPLGHISSMIWEFFFLSLFQQFDLTLHFITSS